MKTKNNLNIMKKISKGHLKLCEKNIILPEEGSVNSRYVYIHILFTFLVYRESAQEKIPPIIFKITGKVVIPLVYRGFRAVTGGNQVVTGGNRAITAATQHVDGKKKAVAAKKHKNPCFVTLQPYAYIPP
ncbi:MAG: hypothetical protein LBF57_00005 [Holosporaceae bacterium]|nr:hypothetical protein [Holosporaceae bacterium]